MDIFTLCLLVCITLVHTTGEISIRQISNTCRSHSPRKEDCGAWHYCDTSVGECVPCNTCGPRDMPVPESSAHDCRVPVQCTGNFNYVSCRSLNISGQHLSVPYLGTNIITECIINGTNIAAPLKCSWNGSVPVWEGDFSCETLKTTQRPEPVIGESHETTSQSSLETTQPPKPVIGESNSQSFLAVLVPVGSVLVIAVVLVTTLVGLGVKRSLIKQRCKHELERPGEARDGECALPGTADITRHPYRELSPLLPVPHMDISVSTTSTSTAYASEESGSSESLPTPIQETQAQETQPQDTRTDHRLDLDLDVQSAPMDRGIEPHSKEEFDDINPKEPYSNLPTAVERVAIDVDETHTYTKRKRSFQYKRGCNKPTGYMSHDMTDHSSSNSKSHPGESSEDRRSLSSDTECEDADSGTEDAPKVSFVSHEETEPKTRPAPTEDDWPSSESSIDQSVSTSSGQYSEDSLVRGFDRRHGDTSMNTLSFDSPGLTFPSTDLDVRTVPRQPDEQDDPYASASTTRSVQILSVPSVWSAESGVGTDSYNASN